MKRRILSIFCVLALCLGLLPPITASAAAGEMTQYTHYLALGDRTCATYPSYENRSSCVFPYPAQIAKNKGYILTTSANTGETSASLLKRLPEEQAQIEESAVISVTIGNTDLLYALRDYLTETYNEKYPNSTLTADQVLDEMGYPQAGFFSAMNTDEVGGGFVESAFYKEAAEALKDNLAQIVKTIQSYNSTACLLVFNLYNPYYNGVLDGEDTIISPYKKGIPTAYDNGATALNTVIAEVCEDSGAHVVDAYDAGKSVSAMTNDSYRTMYALWINVLSKHRYYSGVEAFYLKSNVHQAITDKALVFLPQGAGWPVNSDYYNHPPADWAGILIASTGHAEWEVDQGSSSFRNVWGASITDAQSALTKYVNYLNLMHTWLAPKDIRNGCDGPYLHQDRYWKITGGLLDFDSGSETAFEDWNIWLDEENATLSLRDVQLKAETNCLHTNADISDIFGEDNDTLNIALEGSNSFRSRAFAAILTDGTGNLRFTGEGSLEITNADSPSFTNYVINMPNGGLSIADGAQVTVHTVPSSYEATAVEAKTVTIEDGGTLTVDLVAGSNTQPFASDSVKVEAGGSLQVAVGSSLQAELPNLDESSDLSNSTFTVDGLLVLSDWSKESLETSGASFAGSGLVELKDGVYSISNGSLTSVDEETIVSGNIAVTLGEPDTENPGYTWAKDEETGAWVLTLKASTVVGNVTITQDTGEYDDPEEVETPEKTYANPDIVIQLVTENPCTIYGQVECAVTGRYIYPTYRYFYQLGTLEISGAGLAADTVSYQFGTVQLSGALDATSISAWQLHLLEDADLTLSRGVSLTVNNSSYSAILYQMYKYPGELAQYDNDKVKELVMARLENTFIMEDGALYSYTGAEGTSIQIKLTYSSLLGISLGDFTAPEYDYQKFRIDLTQEVLASILQIPYDLKSAASPVFSQDTHSQENDQRGIFDGYITLQSEGTLELPVPDPPAGGTSGGSTGPSTGSSDGWSQIEKELEQSAPGSTVTVDMNGTTEVPAEVFEAVAGKDVTLELDMGGGVKWEINGKDIPADTDFTDLDLGVKLNTSTIPVDVINLVTGEKGAVQMTLAHDGEFGFTMTLTAPLGTENKGLWANLYHYNTPQKRMLFETAAKVDANGNVSLPFTHASEYAIVLDEKSHELPFTDVADGDWFQAAVEYVYRQGIMAGTSGTTFEPNTTLSRAMVAQILYNLEGQPDISEENLGYPYSDVDAEVWYGDTVYWARLNGVATGYEDNTFRPDKAVTREELAQMLYNYAKYKEITLPALGDLSKFPDGDKVSSWARTAMSWATGLQVIGGYEDTTLRPGGSTTRAEAASMILGLATKLVSIPA